MHVLNVRNVHEALPTAIDYLLREGIARDSRNGPVLQAPGPVTTVYEKPHERVLFWPDRAANPFFHLFESLWMLAGRNDVAYVAQFVRRMANFSDDGEVFNAAYGFRWREHFTQDQLPIIIDKLKRNKDDRRAVLAMWDAGCDLMNAESTESASSKDLPCNLAVHFQINPIGALDMTVFNRSNDIIWGCYGANAVHMSILQEYMAYSIGVSMGRYWQISNNWHAYVSTLEPLKHLADQAADPLRSSIRFDYYTTGILKTFPLMQTPRKDWDLDLKLFMEDPGADGFRDPFFHKIAKPMFMAHKAYKDVKHYGAHRYEVAAEILTQMPKDIDWRFAAEDWITAKHEKSIAVADGGSQHAMES